MIVLSAITIFLLYFVGSSFIFNLSGTTHPVMIKGDRIALVVYSPLNGSVYSNNLIPVKLNIYGPDEDAEIDDVIVTIHGLSNHWEYVYQVPVKNNLINCLILIQPTDQTYRMTFQASSEGRTIVARSFFELKIDDNWGATGQSSSPSTVKTTTATTTTTTVKKTSSQTESNTNVTNDGLQNFLDDMNIPGFDYETAVVAMTTMMIVIELIKAKKKEKKIKNRSNRANDDNSDNSNDDNNSNNNDN